MAQQDAHRQLHPPPEQQQQQQPQQRPNALLAGLLCAGHTHLIAGSNALAASRCAQSLAAGANPVLVAPSEHDAESRLLHTNLRSLIDDGTVRWERRSLQDDDVLRLGRPEVNGVVDAVFITEHNHQDGTDKDTSQAARVVALCRTHRIPVNVVDAPHLCTLTLLSVHADGPLQVGVTTNGRGCKLASRVRREIAASLPADLGAACERLGNVRRRIIQEDSQQASGAGGDGNDDGNDDGDDSLGQPASFNRLVREGEDDNNDHNRDKPVATTTTNDARKSRRMRWLAQVCEYWPLRKLASISDADVDTLFTAYKSASSSSPPLPPSPASPTSPSTAKLGRIILAGSGPGHPDLLTRATHKALAAADLVLADKLVPSAVLDLVPRRTPIRIARKFPGNADAAQAELQAAALEAARAGQTVVRLKQGDPFVYGRGAEEVAAFMDRHAGGLPAAHVVVLPGITSALSAPLFAAIPPTHRDVADQILVCTGTGKKGTPPAPPEFVPSRTAVFLMALHRIAALVRELTEPLDSDHPLEPDAAPVDRRRALWPLSTPCAVVERASCPDQRVIRTTLAHVVDAVESEGSRPPGLLIVGAACEVLHLPQDEQPWVVEEGFRGVEVESDVGWGAALEEVAKMGME